MRKHLSLSFLIALTCLTFTSAQAESLVVLDTRTCTVDSLPNINCPICALLLEGDTVLCGSTAGIMAQYDRNEEWEKLVDCVPSGDWWDDCENKKEFDFVFLPARLMQIRGSDELVVFDSYCSNLLTLPLPVTHQTNLKLWWKAQDDYYIREINLQGNLLVCGIWSESDKLLLLSRTDDKKSCRTIVDFTPDLRAKLDSLGIDQAYCSPALNPHDSTIWFSIWGYSYLHIADIDGKLLDSVEITAEDYVPPGPPRSRIQSEMVHRDWLSRWTPPNEFMYVPSGYFVLQYHQLGWRETGVPDSLSRYSLCAWTDDKQPVKLEADERWQLAGVQPDGRVIFGYYDIEGETCQIVLKIARIQI